MSSICSGEVEFGRQHGVERVEGDEAALLGGLDHLLDAGVVEIEQRQRRFGGAFGVLFRGLFLDLRLCLSRHNSSVSLDRPRGLKNTPLYIGNSQGAMRPAGAAPESGRQCRRNPLKLRLTTYLPRESTSYSLPVRHFAAPPCQSGPCGPCAVAHKLRTPRPEEAPNPSIRASVPSICDRRALTSRSRR